MPLLAEAFAVLSFENAIHSGWLYVSCRRSSKPSSPPLLLCNCTLLREWLRNLGVPLMVEGGEFLFGVAISNDVRCSFFAIESVCEDHCAN